MMMMIVVLRCGVAVMAAWCRDRAPWWLYESDSERQPRRLAHRDRAHQYILSRQTNRDSSIFRTIQGRSASCGRVTRARPARLPARSRRGEAASFRLFESLVQRRPPPHRGPIGRLASSDLLPRPRVCDEHLLETTFQRATPPRFAVRTCHSGGWRRVWLSL